MTELQLSKPTATLQNNTDRQGDNECWPYTGRGRGKAYGRISWRDGAEHHTIAAHRLAYELAHGGIPDGMVVMHSCHAPLCVNPRHLTVGTHQDNSDDMVRAGRSADQRGSRNGNAKLNDEQRTQAVRMRADGAKLREVAALFGVHLATVSHLCRTWRR